MSRSIHLLALLSVFVAACSPIVGASCIDGLSACAGRCVDLSNDPENCGACGVACPTGVACVAGACGGRLDAGLDAPSDAFGLDATDTGDPDAVPLDADAGELDATPLDADTGELDATPLDADDLDATPLDVGPSDVPDAPPCLPTEAFCAGLCVDPLTDPEHCGGCGVVCASGLCTAGACVGSPSGHLVVIGHDYEVSRIAMRRVVGNAVFLARTTPVRVLAFVGDATASSVSGTDAAITSAATDLGRVWTRTTASGAEVPAMLAAADVLLVYPQRGATDATLDALGAAWRDPLLAFLAGGGVVVVLETTSPTNAGTHRLLAPAGLFPVTPLTDVSRAVLTVVAPSDAVVLGVPRTYRGERTTVRFDATLVGAAVADASGAPVVVHTTH